MQGYGLIVRFVLKPGHAGAFDQLVAETIDGIRSHEPGTLVYVNHKSATPDEGVDVRYFYELYADRAAFEAHEEQPHTRRFLAARSEHVDSVTVDFLDLIDGKGAHAGADTR
jgi:quinol monooxygenase YgiN